MKELKSDIKNKDFKRVYLLFGEERFLVEFYAKEIRSAAVDSGMAQMNVEVFTGKLCSVDAAVEAAEHTAFMSDYRLIVLNDSGLFTTGRKADSEKLAAFLPEIPDTTVMIFLETDVDRRGRLYKKAAELGRAIEFKQPPENELIGWLEKLLAKESKKISSAAARLLIGTTAGDMQLLYNEVQKLAAHAAGETIEEADIDAVCVKALETRVFDLVAAIGNKDTRRGLEIFNNMLLMKESPIMVLAMIARQLRLILQCKHLYGRRHTEAEIASVLGLRTFMVGDYLRQSRNFTEEKLMAALRAVLDSDFDIKTGRIGDKLAVEMLILSLADER